jgi:hypothetical protein
VNDRRWFPLVHCAPAHGDGQAAHEPDAREHPWPAGLDLDGKVPCPPAKPGAKKKTADILDVRGFPGEIGANMS